jgi:hypothetical protein
MTKVEQMKTWAVEDVMRKGFAWEEAEEQVRIREVEDVLDGQLSYAGFRRVELKTGWAFRRRGCGFQYEYFGA